MRAVPVAVLAVPAEGVIDVLRAAAKVAMAGQNPGINNVGAYAIG